MRARRSKSLFLGIAAMTVAALAWWLFFRAAKPSAPVAQAPQPAAPVVVAPPSPVADATEAVAPVPTAPVAMPPVAVAPVPVAVIAPSAVPAAPSAMPVAPPSPARFDEDAASRRMYLAHAPLREPEVADPDSEANRRILQTMVTKALSMPAGSQPNHPNR